MLDIKHFLYFLKVGVHVPEDVTVWPKQWTQIESKKYQRALAHFTYESTSKVPTKSLIDALNSRKSGDNLTGTVSREELISILSYATQQKDGTTSRPYPSAGRLYPLEIYYLHAKSNDFLHSGLYHYSQVDKILTYIKKTDTLNVQTTLGSPQAWIKDAAGAIILTYLPKRNVSKYKDFALRATLLEAGALMQTISLTSILYDVKTRIIGFSDNKILDDYLEIDGVHELPITMCAIGK